MRKFKKALFVCIVLSAFAHNGLTFANIQGNFFMKEIKLTQGKVALVDDEDFESLNQWKWYASKYKYTWYARRWNNSEPSKHTWMHRQILGLTDRKIQGDHIDRDGLNNQRINLRIATQAQNNANRRYARQASSKYNGVIHRVKRKKYEAVIVVNYKNKYLGMFINEIDAARAYNRAAIRIHGEFANLNLL